MNHPVSHFFKNIEYKYLVAAIYTCILFLDRLDLTIVNITLPTLAKHFHVSIIETDWITNSFLLALAITIPISSWIGDRFGLKKTFIIATFFYGLSSLLCAFSPDITFMIIMRFVEGLSGGFIIPIGLTMVYRVFDHTEYASITSYVAIPSLAAPALGPALGGLILYLFNWRWVFIFVGPICFITVITALFLLKEQKNDDNKQFDWPGFMLSATSLILLLYFLTMVSRNGLNITNLFILIWCMLSVYFLIHFEKTASHPLINLNYFQNKLFLQANLLQLIFQIAHFGAIFLIGMYLQVGSGISALASGIIMGMQAIGAIFVNRYSVKLFQQFGPSRPLIIGFMGNALLTPCILFINHPDKMMMGMALLFIRGIFSGFCGIPIQATGVIDFPKSAIGDVNMLFNAGRQISISLGVALSSLLIAYGYKVNPQLAHLTQNGIGYPVFIYAFILISIVLCFGIICALTINNQKVIAIANMTTAPTSM